MKYKPRPGDYGVISTDGIMGFLIQLGTFSKENHAVVYVGNGKIVEATTGSGVVISDVSSYKNIIWNKNDDLTTKHRLAICEHAMSLIGSPYSFRNIFVIALRIFGARIPDWVEIRLSRDKGLICSELVVMCYRFAGLRIVPGVKPYFVTPSDLMYRLLLL